MPPMDTRLPEKPQVDTHTAPEQVAARSSPPGSWTKSRWTWCRSSSGSGKRYFGSIEGQRLLDDPQVVIQGERVQHLRFKVVRAA